MNLCSDEMFMPFYFHSNEQKTKLLYRHVGQTRARIPCASDRGMCVRKTSLRARTTA